MMECKYILLLGLLASSVASETIDLNINDEPELFTDGNENEAGVTDSETNVGGNDGISSENGRNGRPFCRLCICNLNIDYCESPMEAVNEERCLSAGPVCCCCKPGRHPCINFSQAGFQPADPDTLEDLDVTMTQIRQIE